MSNISMSMDSLYSMISANNKYVSPNYKSITNVSANDDISDVKTETDVLQNKIKKLKNYRDSTYQESKEIRNINNFVKEYNAFKKKTDKAGDSSIEKEMNKLVELLRENKKDLKAAGISINDKGFLGFKSDDFEDVDKKVLKRLFSGNDSPINKASKIIRNIKNKTKDLEYTTNIIKYRPSTYYTSAEVTTASSCMALMNHYLNSYNVDSYDEKKSSLNGFVNFYNNILESNLTGISNSVQNIIQASNLNEDKLNKIGISIDEETKKLEYDENNAATPTESATAFETLFQNTASYSTDLKSNIIDIFKTSMKTEKIGVTIDSSI